MCIKQLWMLFVVTGALAQGTDIRVETTTGNIDVRTTLDWSPVSVKAVCAGRECRANEVRQSREGVTMRYDARPSDGARVDLQVTLPYASTFQAWTNAGSISVTGLTIGGLVVTQSGEIGITAPLKFTSIEARCNHKPKIVALPKNFQPRESQGEWKWTLHAPSDGIYGTIVMGGERPARIRVFNRDIPNNWWVIDAIAALESIERHPVERRRSPPVLPASVSSGHMPMAAPDATPVFRSDVRMVTLTANVFDKDGHRITGLGPGDFEILEDGIPQNVASVEAEELPFNLALLLDLSGSTKADWRPMVEAAKRFLSVARPQDRVAVYSFARSEFQVISLLSKDRPGLKQAIEAILQLPAGDTPLYRSIVLSYAQESLHLAPDRTALVVLTDSFDSTNPCRVHDASFFRHAIDFKRLVQAAAESPVLVYPIILPDEVGQPCGTQMRENMQALADASGGRLFDAPSLQAIDPVYAQVAGELRSLYSIGYYPRNQNFDGSYRRIKVRVKTLGVTLRTRDGYYAF